MKHVIDKAVEFCYGHRVWTQQLDAEFSIDTCTKCRNLHGHQGTMKIFLEAEELNPQQMVVDFKMTNWLKKFLDDRIDHKFIVDRNDPLYESFIDGSLNLLPIFIDGVPGPVGHVVDLEHGIDGNPITGSAREWYESFYVINFVPTSENLSKWIFEIAAIKMAALGKVVRVDWHETPKSRASYLND